MVFSVICDDLGTGITPSDLGKTHSNVGEEEKESEKKEVDKAITERKERKVG